MPEMTYEEFVEFVRVRSSRLSARLAMKETDPTSLELSAEIAAACVTAKRSMEFERETSGDYDLAALAIEGAGEGTGE